MDQLVIYSTALKTSLVRALNKFFDGIPICDNGRTRFVEPIIAKLFLLPTKYIALVAKKNAFQLDLDAKLFGYHLIPALISFKTLLVFAPQDIGLIKEFSVFDSRRAGT